MDITNIHIFVYLDLSIIPNNGTHLFWHTPMTKVHGILGCKRDRHRNHKAQWSYHHSPIRRCPYEVSFQMRELPCHVLAHNVGKPMTYHVIGWHLRVQIKFHLSSVCRVAKSNSSSNFQSYMLTCLPIPTLEFLFFVLLMRFELTRPNGQGIFLPHLLLYKHT